MYASKKLNQFILACVREHKLFDILVNFALMVALKSTFIREAKYWFVVSGMLLAFMFTFNL